MCGIFGFIAQGEVDDTHFKQLAALNTRRGNLGFGYYAGPSGRYNPHFSARYRQRGPFVEGMVDFVHPASIRLGHIKAPTGRRIGCIDDIHPFESDSLLLAHNGLLLNHHTFLHWQLPGQSEVDSQVILGGIRSYSKEGNPNSKSIRETVAQLDGQQACWLWDKQAYQLYLWRVMSPIFINHSSRVFSFSSIIGGEKAGWQSESAQLLKEGSIYQFDPARWTLTVVDTFHYHSPYLLP